MKVAVFSTHVLWPPHYETELEIMQKHLDIGDTVHHIVCQKELNICDLIVDHSFFTNSNPFIQKNEICNRCTIRRKNGSKLLKGKILQKHILNSNLKVSQNLRDEFSSLEDLKNYKLNKYEIGESILSSMITYIRDPYFSVDKYKDVIYNYLISCWLTYYSVLDLLNKENYNLVYVFNGRFSYTRAIFRACQARNVDCFIHDRGNSINYYEVFKNVTPHNLNYRVEEIRRYWEIEPDKLKKEQVGSEFFKERVSGIEQSWFSFVRDQKYGKLPDNWDQKKINIAIFNSSEDEFQAIGKEWQNPIYLNQLDGIKKIINDPRIKNDKSLSLYLRIHPNLKGINNDYMQQLYALKSEQLTIIYPESEVSTYSLLLSSDKVLTFGSSVGIEAVYWGKPSILAGITFYRFLEATYNPNSHEELIQMLLTQLEPKSQEKALMYGFYMKTFGIPFKYYEANGIHSGKFRGLNIVSNDRSLISRIVNKLSQIIKSVS